MKQQDPQHPSNRKKWAIGLYTAAVVTIFGIMMAALLGEKNANTHTRQDSTPAADLGVSRAEIAAIIEEYNTPKVEVNLNQSQPEQIHPNIISKSPSITDEPAWTNHAMRWTETNTPKVAIIIDDLGLDEGATTILAGMDGAYTLAYLPYAENLDSQTKSIREAGHELMVHLPMQSQRDTADPGSNALLTDLPYEEFAERLEWNLTRFGGYVGVNNHMGSRLTENPGLMVRVMARLKRDGYLFVDSLTTPDSVGTRAASAVNVPYVKRDVFLDNERKPTYIMDQLATLERIAKLRGYAVGIGHPYPETLTALKEWQKTLAFKHITLVPISQIVNIATEKRSLSAN